MMLKLIFDKEQEESITYYSNEVCIITSSFEKVEPFLINNIYKQENIEYRKSFLDPSQNLELDKHKEHLDAINLIEKSLKKSFTVNDFDLIDITFNDESSLSNYKSFLERIKNDIIIDASNFSIDNINNLKKIVFQKEPQIRHELNTNLNSLSTFLETMDIITDMKTKINKYSLSKIEQLMLLYDILKKRIYIYGSEQDYASSRDLNRVLKEKEIVCAGYANIFAAVANNLGIPTFVKTYVLTNEKVGHATNVSYFYDEFYEQSYVLEFDATWDSRKDTQDKDWINNYNFFGQAENLATTIKEKSDLKVSSSLLEKLNILYQRYLFFVKNGNIPFIVNSSIKNLMNLAVEIYNYFEDDEKQALLESYLNELKTAGYLDQNIVKSIYLDIHKIHNKGISLTNFLKALYRVRRIEHSIDPTEYPLDFKILEKICGEKYTQDKLLLRLLVNKEIIEELDVLRYVSPKVNNKIKYDINMMKLLHQLRNIAETKDKEKGLTNK